MISHPSLTLLLAWHELRMASHRIHTGRNHMVRKWLVAMVVAGLAVSTASAQDAKAVIANASKAMGVDGLNSIYFYGTAQNGNLGQNNNSNQPWPMAAMNDYVRAIDFTKPTSRATWATYAVPVTGRSRHARAGNTTDPAAHYSRGDGVGPAVGDLGHAVGFPEGSGREQRHRESAVGWWKAVPGRDLELAREVTGWSAVPARGLHQQPEPGRARADLGREPDLRRHARRSGVLAISRQQRPQVSRANGAEARWMAGVRGVRARGARQPFKSASADDADAATGRPRWRARRTGRSWRGAGGTDIGEVGRRRLPTERRVQRAGDRVRRSHRPLRARTAERGAGAGDHRRSEESHPEQADPVRRDLASSLRSHERPAGRGSRGHYDRDARSEQGVPDERALSAADAGSGLVVEVRQEAGHRRVHRR